MIGETESLVLSDHCLFSCNKAMQESLDDFDFIQREPLTTKSPALQGL